MKSKLAFIGLFSLLLLSACNTNPKSKEEVDEKDPFNGNVFLWDFNGSKEFRYDYEMSSVTTESLARDEEALTSKEETVGDLVLQSKANRKATATIQDVVKTMFSLTDEGEWSPGQPRSSRSIDLGALRQYSKFENERLDAVWDAFLPLPLEEIKEGESYELKMKAEVTLEDRKYIRGSNILTFAGYETVMGKKCIKLTGVIDVSEVDPMDFDGTYEHSLKGKGVYYFSPEQHCFVQADVELTLRLLVDSGETEDPIDDMYYNIEATDVFQIRLK